jgi:hypothetical protein
MMSSLGLFNVNTGLAASIGYSEAMGRGANQTNASVTPRAARSQPAALSNIHMTIPDEARGFRCLEREGLTLIAPKKAGKMMRSDWPLEDRPYRSMIVRSDSGEVVSVGLPKFFNYGEDPDETTALHQALASEQSVWFGEKMDGSLAIRSVIDGEVVFRTRATFDGGEHGVAMRRVAAAKYPVLLDPHFAADQSLHFEFVSPNFRVVIRYPEDDLILVGATSHHDLRLAELNELRMLADNHGLQLVPVVELPKDPDELLAVIYDWEGKEGVVARCNQGQTLVKMKAADYLARHRLRFSLTTRAVREICLQRNVTSITDFEAYLTEQGADWELVEDARPLIERFISGRHQARAEFAALEAEVGAKTIEFPDRKDFAVNYATKLAGARSGAAFALLSGQRDRAYTLVETEVLDQAFADMDARDTARLDEELDEE